MYRLYKSASNALPKHFIKGGNELTDSQMRRFKELVAHFDKTVPSGPLFDHIKEVLSPNAPKKVSTIEKSFTNRKKAPFIKLCFR